MSTFKFHYVYRVTSLIENKHYYGSRSSVLHPAKDLGLKYFTSSTDKDFVNDFKQNTHNFKLKIISIFDNREEAMLLEIKLHAKFEVGKNPKFYNKAKAVSTGFSIQGTTLSTQTKEKMSISRKGRIVSEETKEKISKANKNTKHSEKFKEKCKTNSKGNKKRLGIKFTEESKQKISKALIGKTPWNKGHIGISDETRKKMSDSKKNMTQDQKNKMHSWKLGRKCTDEVKKKLSKPQQKVQCPHCDKMGGISAMKQSHFNNCKWRVDNPEK